MRGADRVKVARKVQIDVGHGHDLRIAAACGATFHAETRAQAGLAQTHGRVLADQVQCVAEADR